MTTPTQEKMGKVAQRIVDLTEFGQALHVYDILPDLKELISQATAEAVREERERILELNEENYKDLLVGGVYDKFPGRDKVLVAYNRMKSALLLPKQDITTNDK